MECKRWTLKSFGMHPDVNGNWVKWDEVFKLLQDLDADDRDMHRIAEVLSIKDATTEGIIKEIRELQRQLENLEN
jgi:hypothetical protein